MRGVLWRDIAKLHRIEIVTSCWSKATILRGLSLSFICLFAKSQLRNSFNDGTTTQGFERQDILDDKCDSSIDLPRGSFRRLFAGCWCERKSRFGVSCYTDMGNTNVKLPCKYTLYILFFLDYFSKSVGSNETQACCNDFLDAGWTSIFLLYYLFCVIYKKRPVYPGNFWGDFRCDFWTIGS